MIRIKHASICKHTESNSPIKFSSSYELFQSWRTLQNGLKLNSRCISDERGTNLRWLNGVIKIQDFGFALTRSAIGPSRHPLNQSDAKQKPIMMWSSAFSRTLCTLPRFTLNSHWLMMKWIIVLSECFDYFSFCLFSTTDCSV